MYRVETHLHTSPVSKCAHAGVKETVEFYKKAGYDGIFITNHFPDADNSDRTYEEKVNFYFSDYEKALELSETIGIKVFCGVETTYGGTDFLVYGLSKEWFLAHPEIMNMRQSDKLTLMREDGALIIQAHPFRVRGYLNAIRVCERYTDGIEVANAGNTPLQDAYAARYCKAKGLYTISGSDNHKSQPDSVLFGVGLEEKLDSAQDWVAHILQRKPHTLLCPEDRFDVELAPTLELPAFWMNEQEQFVPMETDWLK